LPSRTSSRPSSSRLDLRHQAGLPVPGSADDDLQAARLEHPADQLIAGAREPRRGAVEMGIRGVEERIALQTECR